MISADQKRHFEFFEENKMVILYYQKLIAGFQFNLQQVQLHRDFLIFTDLY